MGIEALQNCQCTMVPWGLLSLTRLTIQSFTRLSAFYVMVYNPPKKKQSAYRLVSASVALSQWWYSIQPPGGGFRVPDQDPVTVTKVVGTGSTEYCDTDAHSIDVRFGAAFSIVAEGWSVGSETCVESTVVDCCSVPVTDGSESAFLSDPAVASTTDDELDDESAKPSGA